MINLGTRLRCNAMIIMRQQDSESDGELNGVRFIEKSKWRFKKSKRKYR